MTSNAHIKTYFPQQKDVKIVGRPRTRGVFNGNKVNHPWYRNSSTRYRTRRKNVNFETQNFFENRIKSKYL